MSDRKNLLGENVIFSDCSSSVMMTHEQLRTHLNTAHKAGREAGMREAAGMLEGYAVKPTYAGRLGATRIVAVDHAIKAILSAAQEDSTSE